MEKPYFFIMDFKGSHEVLYVTNIFDLYNFDNVTTTLLNFFDISMEMQFVSLLDDTFKMYCCALC